MKNKAVKREDILNIFDTAVGMIMLTVAKQSENPSLRSRPEMVALIEDLTFGILQWRNDIIKMGDSFSEFMSNLDLREQQIDREYGGDFDAFMRDTLANIENLEKEVSVPKGEN